MDEMAPRCRWTENRLRYVLYAHWDSLSGVIFYLEQKLRKTFQIFSAYLLQDVLQFQFRQKCR